MERTNSANRDRYTFGAPVAEGVRLVFGFPTRQLVEFRAQSELTNVNDYTIRVQEITEGSTVQQALDTMFEITSGHWTDISGTSQTVKPGGEVLFNVSTKDNIRIIAGGGAEVVLLMSPTDGMISFEHKGASDAVRPVVSSSSSVSSSKSSVSSSSSSNSSSSSSSRSSSSVSSSSSSSESSSSSSVSSSSVSSSSVSSSSSSNSSSSSSS